MVYSTWFLPLCFMAHFLLHSRFSSRTFIKLAILKLLLLKNIIKIFVPLILIFWDRVLYKSISNFKNIFRNTEFKIYFQNNYFKVYFRIKKTTFGKSNLEYKYFLVWIFEKYLKISKIFFKTLFQNIF